MLDDIVSADEAFDRHMREASELLATCIKRARAGEPTDAPSGLASMHQAARVWGDAEVAALIDLRSRGRTVGQISTILKRSPDGIKAALLKYNRGP